MEMQSGVQGCTKSFAGAFTTRTEREPTETYPREHVLTPKPAVKMTVCRFHAPWLLFIDPQGRRAEHRSPPPALKAPPKQMADLHSCTVILRGRSAPDRRGCTYSDQWAAFSSAQPRWGRSGWNKNLPSALSSSAPGPVLQTREMRLKQTEELNDSERHCLTSEAACLLHRSSLV